MRKYHFISGSIVKNNTYLLFCHFPRSGWPTWKLHHQFSDGRAISVDLSCCPNQFFIKSAFNQFSIFQFFNFFYFEKKTSNTLDLDTFKPSNNHGPIPWPPLSQTRKNVFPYLLIADFNGDFEKFMRRFTSFHHLWLSMLGRPKIGLVIG